MPIINYLLIIVLYVLIWTFHIYWVHRIAHIPHKYNFLFKLHLTHHKEYGYRESLPKWHNYFLWFGSFKESLDDWITITLPPLIFAIFDPYHGVPLFILHYIYEVFIGPIIDHHPKIRGRITKFLPIGQFHLTHHRNSRKNYSLIFTLWDYVFGTANLKDINSLEDKRAQKY